MKRTLDEQVDYWVNGFNSIPQEVVAKLWMYEPDSMFEITPLALYDRVYVYTEGAYGEIQSRKDDGDIVVELEGEDRVVTVGTDECEIVDEYREALPMWGTMWTFSDSVDKYMIENDSGKMLQKMADNRLRIYKSDYFGYIFGVDGAGFSFRDEIFKPLYKEIMEIHE